MKKLTLLSCCLYSFLCYSQQTILKVKLPGVGKAETIQITPDMKKGIDSFNTTVKPFKENGTVATLKPLLLALNNPAIDTFPEVKQLRKKLQVPFDFSNDTLLSAALKRALPGVDSLKVNTTATPNAITGACPTLANIIVKYILDDNDNSIGILEDTAGNALESFTLIQSNKELFYDKLRKALTNRCDSAAVDMIIQRCRTADLYTAYLEGKDELSNTNILAGTLKIFRKSLVRYMSDDPPPPTPGSKVGYPDIKSIKKAKTESGKAITAAADLKKQLDTLAKQEKQAAHSHADSVRAGQIDSAAREIDKEVADAIVYRDSISNKIPDEKILYFYNKTIQLSGMAQQNAKKEMDAIGGAFNRAALRDSAFTIQSIQIQFEDGFIENIKLFGKLNGNPHLLRFENVYPIGFSTKRDFRNLIEIYLYEKSDYLTNKGLFIKLGEVLSYDQNLTNYNKDYSPANQVLTIQALPDSIKEVSLYKEQTSKLLEVQVFSDLKGTDETNPNGLIQLELNKRLNFFSRRYPLTKNIFLPWKWFDKDGEIIANFGLGNYVTPQFTIDKIENNQKRLVLSHIDTLSLAADTSKPLTYTSTINLLRHQIYSVGFDQSLLLIDIPSIKSTVNLGTGIHFGRTAIQDTLRTRKTIDSTHFIFNAAPSNNVIEYGINTFQWGPYITWQVFPDSRFGITATQRFTWFKALTSNFIQVRDSAHYLKFIAQTPKDQIRTTPYSYYNYGSSNWFIKNIDKPFSLFTKCIASAEIFAYFSPNSDGSNKIFFRYRINWDVANPKENFHQVQVGFATYLTATKEYDKLKKAANID